MQRSALCRSRRELSNAYLLVKIGVDTAENELLQVVFNIIQYYSFVSLAQTYMPARSVFVSQTVKKYCDLLRNWKERRGGRQVEKIPPFASGLRAWKKERRSYKGSPLALSAAAGSNEAILMRDYRWRDKNGVNANPQVASADSRKQTVRLP